MRKQSWALHIVHMWTSICQVVHNEKLYNFLTNYKAGAWKILSTSLWFLQVLTHNLPSSAARPWSKLFWYIREIYNLCNMTERIYSSGSCFWIPQLSPNLCWMAQGSSICLTSSSATQPALQQSVSALGWDYHQIPKSNEWSHVWNCALKWKPLPRKSTQNHFSIPTGSSPPYT